MSRPSLRSQLLQVAAFRINEGPFKGLKTLFSHFDGDERAVLLLNILEKTVKGKFNLLEFSVIK